MYVFGDAVSAPFDLTHTASAHAPAVRHDVAPQLSIPMCEVISLEKRMTAFVIPNAIQLSTRTAKYTFTSFLSRDTTFDVLYNVWRLARPEDSYDMGASSQRVSLDEGEDAAAAADGGAVNGAGAVAKKAAAKAKVTQCECGRAGKHYTETAMDAIFPGTPEKIYNLMFTSGFMKDFMRENQKLIGAYLLSHTRVHGDYMRDDGPLQTSRSRTGRRRRTRSCSRGT